MAVAEGHLDAEELSDAVDGLEDGGVAAHLEGCPACRDHLDTWRRALGRLTPPAPAERAEVDAVVATALAAAPASTRRPPGVPVTPARHRPPLRWRGIAAVAAVAALVAGAVIGLSHLHLSSGTSQAASSATSAERTPATTSGGAESSGSATHATGDVPVVLRARDRASLTRQLRALQPGPGPGRRRHAGRPVAAATRCRSTATGAASAAGYTDGPLYGVVARLAGRGVQVWTFASGERRLAVVTASSGCGLVAELHP